MYIMTSRLRTRVSVQAPFGGVTPREILATEKVAKSLEQLLRMSGQLAHLVKGIKKGKAKAFDTQLGEWKKGDKEIIPTEALILMVNRGGHTSKIKSTEESVNRIGEITFPPISGFDNSPDPVIIRLKPTIRSLRVDSKILLVGFSGEHLWPLGEVPLEVTMEETPYIRTETLNFVIVRSNSLYNLLIGRTTMQKMGIVVSTIHAAIKFCTPCGIGTVFSTYEPNKVKEGQKKVKETVPEVTKDVLSCLDAEERIIVNDKHPEQIVVIGKQLPTTFKRRLQDLMWSNADVFA
ncbi:hypothetical protein Tco_0863547 [Tanacetum coccineum]